MFVWQADIEQTLPLHCLIWSHHSLMRWVPFFSLLYGWGNRGTYHLRSHGWQVVELRYKPRQSSSRTCAFEQYHLQSQSVPRNYEYVTLRLCWILYPVLPQVPEQMLKIFMRAGCLFMGQAPPCCPGVALLELGPGGTNNSGLCLHIPEYWFLFWNIMKWLLSQNRQNSI